METGGGDYVLTLSVCCWQSDIPAIQDAALEIDTITELAHYVTEVRFKKGQLILEEDLEKEASVYRVKKGKVQIVREGVGSNKIVDTEGIFGQDQPMPCQP